MSLKISDFIFSKTSLSSMEMEEAIEKLLSEADPFQVAAFLSILKYRGETAEELVGMVNALQKKALSVRLPFDVIDIVGTGGDGAQTVNISTGSAILTAACGVPVAKHGNRAVSSRSGSADVLEALGIEVEMPIGNLTDCLREVNLAFLYAPLYHPCLKRFSSIRQGLKVPTVFNLLGPLLNPANASFGLIGVASMDALDKVSQAIVKQNTKKRVFVFHGSGLDELTPIGPAMGFHVCSGQRELMELHPKKFGFDPCTVKDLQGGDADQNARLLMRAFEGNEGPLSDSLIFTTGVALWIFGHSFTVEEGIEMSRQALKQRKALKVLEKWRQFSKKLKT